MTTTFKIEGIEEADELLSQLSRDMRTGALGLAVNAYIREVKRVAKQNAPKGGYPGDNPGKVPLEDAIDTKKVEYDSYVLGMVGARRPDGSHLHLIEGGTKAHEIKSEKGKRLRDPDLDPSVHRGFGTVVQHPGTRPEPFLEKSVNEAAPTATRKMLESLERSINRAYGL